MFKRFMPPARVATALAAIIFVAALSACSSKPERPKPAELAPNAALLGVRLAWTARLGDVNFPLQAQVNGTSVTLAGSDGTVAAIDAASGRDLWRGSVGAPIAAGVGSDAVQARRLPGSR